MPEDRREGFYRDRIRECGPFYAGFDLLSSEAAVNLIFTYDHLHQMLNRYMAEFGLSRSTFNVLMLLRHGDTGGTLLHDLGELLLVSRANITGLIDHLEQKGYVRRVVDEHDRRARFARLTPAGEHLLDRVIPVHFRAVANMLRGLDEKEKQALIALLVKTRRSMAEHAVGAG